MIKTTLQNNSGVIITVVTVFLFSTFYMSHAETVATKKDEIRRLFISAMASYAELKDKMEIAEQTKYLDDIKTQLNDYFELAKKLEEQGRYQQAAECYNKILKLCQDSEIKNHIREKNKEFKKLAQQTQRIALKKISEQKRSILSVQNSATSSQMPDLEDEQAKRSRLLKKLQEKVKRLEQERKRE